MKKKLGFVGIISAMLGLCFILFLVESGADEASITTFQDALWYMIVTLTTVGYGDVYPVTLFGKVLGVLFVLGSMGLLGFIIASLARFFNSDMLPLFYLTMNSKEKWYVFSEYNEHTEMLIRDLKKSENGLFICLRNKCDRVDNGVLILNRSFDKVIEKKADKSGLYLIFARDTENDHENYQEYRNTCKAYLNGAELPFSCYCMTDYVPEFIPANLFLFNRYEITARLYWNDKPLDTKEDESVIIIGMGHHGRYLLEQALTRNVVRIGQSVQYHVFGDSEEFCSEHYCLGDYFSINEKDEARDSVFFHDSNWHSEHEIIENASRIILCDDDEEKNLQYLSDIRKYYVVKGQIHILFGCNIDEKDVYSFGLDDDIYTADMVLKEKLNASAMEMHRNYAKNNVGAPLWNELSEFKRQSNLAVADHVGIKLRLLGVDDFSEAYAKYEKLTKEEKSELWKLEHERWCRFHIVNNWRYAKTRNDSQREHNLLLPFEDLPADEKVKDSYAWESLKTYMD